MNLYRMVIFSFI